VIRRCRCDEPLAPIMSGWAVFQPKRAGMCSHGPSAPHSLILKGPILRVNKRNPVKRRTVESIFRKPPRFLVVRGDHPVRCRKDAERDGTDRNRTGYLERRIDRRPGTSGPPDRRGSRRRQGRVCRLPAYFNRSRFTTPAPSRTVTSWSAATFPMVSRAPLGQRISRSATAALPRPKCRRRSLTER